MSLIAILNPEPCQYLTRERLAGSNLKIVSQYCPVNKEVTVYDDVRMTVGKAIEDRLVFERDYLQNCDTDIITVKVPKKAKVTVGFEEYKKVIRAIGFTPLKGGNDDDSGEKKKEKKYHLNKEKLQDRPYELSFAANNSKSVLDSLEVSENTTLWSWLTKQLPFELTTAPIHNIYAIVNLKLVPPVTGLSTELFNVDNNSSNKKSKIETGKMTIDVVAVNGKFVTNVYFDKSGKDNEVNNPLSHLTILGTVGKDQLLVVNNNDKKKKKFVINKPQTSFMPPTVDIKYVFLVQKHEGDVFHCLYVSGDDEFNVRIHVPYNVQRKGIIRDFVLWLPDSVDIVNQ